MKAGCSQMSDPVMDFDRFSQRLEADAELMRELVDLYIVTYATLLDELQDAASALDTRRVQRTAHRIKGIARNFCADPSALAAEIVERIGESGQLAGCSEAVDRLVAELHRLHGTLVEFLEKN